MRKLILFLFLALPAFAQYPASYELICPPGSTPLNWGTAQNPSTQKARAFACYNSSTGQVTWNDAATNATANIVYASKLGIVPGGDASAALNTAAAAMTTGGTIIVDLSGNYTWTHQFNMQTGVFLQFYNCATFDATSLGSTPFLSANTVYIWGFVGNPTPPNGKTSDCTIFYVANTANQNIYLFETAAFQLAFLSIQKKGAVAGGDAIDCFSCQSAWVHDMSIAPFTSGGTWVDAVHIAIDPGGSPTSSIYNTWDRIRVLPFSGAVGGITGCVLNMIGGNSGGSTKTVNDNNFTDWVGGPHSPSGGTGVCASIATGTVPLVNEERFKGGDFSGNVIGINLAVNATRNIFFDGTTVESCTGVGVVLNTGNFYPKLFMEITGNTSGGATCATQITDNSSYPIWHSNVPKCNGAQFSFTATGTANIPQGQGLGIDGGAGTSAGTTGNLTAINFPAGDTIAASGTNLLLGNTGGFRTQRGITVGGTTFTTSGGCSEGTLVGGTNAGTFVTSGSTGCSTTVTMGGGSTSINGWACWAHDVTTAGDANNPSVKSASTTTAIIATGTIVAGDKIEFGCVGF